MLFRSLSEELVSLATGDDEGFFVFVLNEKKDYPGNLNATDFGQYPLDLIVVLKLYEELEGDIGDLLPGCVNLRVFVVTGNKKLTGDIQALENCPNMTETDFSDCSKIEGGCCSLEELEECSSLSFLRPVRFFWKKFLLSESCANFLEWLAELAEISWNFPRSIRSLSLTLLLPCLPVNHIPFRRHPSA